MASLFCPDSFKDCVSSFELASSIEGVSTCPLSDGGEGLLDIIGMKKKLTWQKLLAHDPYGNKREVTYAIFDDLAVVEAARVIGYEGQPKASILERNSFGLGEMIEHAFAQGANKVLVGGGGTGVHDGGVGLMQALGARFLDADGQERQWKDFEEVTSFVPPTQNNLNIHVLCDVESTWMESLTLYAPNKGASAEELQQLGQRFEKLLSLYGPETVRAGVGGGISFALANQCGAQLVSGFEFLSELFDLENKIIDCDQVITGEGRVDLSTLSGKLVSGVAALAHKHGKKCTVICGSWDGTSSPQGVETIHCLSDIYGVDLDKERSTARIQEIINTKILT